MKTTKKSTTVSNLPEFLPIDTLSLVIYYGNNNNRDFLEVVKKVAPIREKMFSSRHNNIYMEVFKPARMTIEVFAQILSKRLAGYGFSSVVVEQASSYRKKNGSSRQILEQFFDEVEYKEGVLALSVHHKEAKNEE